MNKCNVRTVLKTDIVQIGSRAVVIVKITIARRRRRRLQCV